MNAAMLSSILALCLASSLTQAGVARAEHDNSAASTYARLAPFLAGAAYAYESASSEQALPVPLSAELLRSITSGPEPLCGIDVLDQLDQLAVVVLTPLLGGGTSSGEGGGALSGLDSRSGHSSTTAEDAHRQLTLYESVKGLFGWLAEDSGCGGLGDVDCLREQAAAALASSGGALEELAARTAATCGLGPVQLAEAAGHLAAALAALAAPERRAALVDAAEHVARAGWCTCGGQKHAPHGHGGGSHGGVGGASARAAAVYDDEGEGLGMGEAQEAQDGREEQEQEVPTGAGGGGDSTGATGAARSAGVDAGDVLPLGPSLSAGMDTAGAAGEDGSGLLLGLVLRQYRPGVVLWVSDGGAVIRQDAAVAEAADDDGDGYGSSSSRGTGSSRSSGSSSSAAAAIATASGAPARRLSSHDQHRRDQHRSRHHDRPHPHRHQHWRRLQQSSSAFTSSPDVMRNVQYNYYLPPVPPPEPSSYPPNVLLPLVFHVMLYRDAATRMVGPPGYDSAPALAARTVAAVNLLASGTGVRFFLQEVRWDLQRYPYLLVGGPADWQTCGAVVSGGLDESAAAPDCLRAQAVMVDFPRAINVYFVGSSTLFATPGLGSTGSSPVGSRSELPVWLAWNNLDVPARGGTNGPESYNAGSSVLWHELGHYLGLRHTFPADGKCADSDGVPDTPNVAATASSLYLDKRLAVDLNDHCYTVFMRDLQGDLGAAPSRVGIPDSDKNAWADTCPDDPGYDELGNFMTYTLPSCRAGLGHMTPGQVDLMHAELRSNRHMYEWGRYWAELQPPPQLLPQQPQPGGGAGGGGGGGAGGAGGGGGGGGADPGRPDTALCTSPLRYPGCACKDLWLNYLPEDRSPAAAANLAQRGTVPVWQGGGCAPYYSRSNTRGDWACEVEDGCTVNGKTYGGAGVALILPCEGAKFMCTDQQQQADNSTLEEAICTRPPSLSGCSCKPSWRLRGRTYRAGCAPVGALLLQDPASWWCELAAPCVVAGKAYQPGTFALCDQRAAAVCSKYQQYDEQPPAPQPPAAKPSPSPKRRAGKPSPSPAPSPLPSPSPSPVARVRGG